MHFAWKVEISHFKKKTLKAYGIFSRKHVLWNNLYICFFIFLFQLFEIAYSQVKAYPYRQSY
jgi:hypothetical protein